MENRYPDNRLIKNMYSVHKRAFYSLIALIAWVILIIALMFLSYQIDLEIFFVLWLIALLVVAELIGDTTVQPRALQYLKYFIALQVVIFGIIVARKVMEILNK
jgi:hypothetical protein